MNKFETRSTKFETNSKLNFQIVKMVMRAFEFQILEFVSGFDFSGLFMSCIKEGLFYVNMPFRKTGGVVITIEDFKKIELRVAVIESAEPHPNADRLYVLKVKVGEERKTIVAGIRAHYGPEELEGKKIVIVNNLEPTVLRGVESQGMLLAASDGQSLGLVTPERFIGDGANVR
jgi:tRNA-binding protein